MISDAPNAPMFFYGTLRDEDLLEVVTSRSGLQGLTLQDAGVRDMRVVREAVETFPILVEAVGERAHGLLVDGLTPEERARIAFFEDSDYRLAEVETLAHGRQVLAHTFLPSEKLDGSNETWELTAWRREHKALMLACVEEQMSYFGRVEQAIVETWWPDIKARARGRIGDYSAQLRSSLSAEDVAVSRQETPYANHFRVDELTVDHRTFAGGRSAPLNRAVFRMGPAVTVLPYDAQEDAVLLIEQFRAGPYAARDPQPWTIEVIAGRFEIDEDSPGDVARREAEEEGGVQIRRLERIGAYYASPGAVDEMLHGFVGEARLAEAGGVFGLAHEGEDIRAVKMPFMEAMHALARGEVNTAPAALSLLWLARNRDRLRLAWR